MSVSDATDQWERAESIFYAQVEAFALAELARLAFAHRRLEAHRAQEELVRATVRANAAIDELNRACDLLQATVKLVEAVR